MGTVTVSRTPPQPSRFEITQADREASFSLELLTDARIGLQETGLTHDGDEIGVSADNGRLLYRIVEWEPHTRSLRAVLIASTVEGITP